MFVLDFPFHCNKVMATSQGKTILDSGWFAARFNDVHFTGTQLTTTNPPSGPTLPWMEAQVPGTCVFSLLLQHAMLHHLLNLAYCLLIEIKWCSILI